MTATFSSRRLMVAAAVMLAAAAVSSIVLSAAPRYAIPRGWTLRMHYIGTQTNADAAGILPEEDVVGVYTREQTVLSDAAWPDSVRLRDAYIVRTIDTDSIIFEYVTEAWVDPRTGEHRALEWRDQYNLFPPDVKKRTYRMRSNYLEDIPLRYAGPVKVGDVVTYEFGYHGPIEYTKAYKGTAAYPGVPVKAGQRIACADSAFYFRVWVEPLTGEIVRLTEGCPSADYLEESATGRRIQAVDRWEGVTEGRDLRDRLLVVREARRRVLLRLWGTPSAFAMASVLLAGVGVTRRGARNRELAT